jgi:hypothetical protein
MRSTCVTSAEDTVISKLEWAREGESDRQLRDVAGVVAAKGEDLDRGYIERWAEELGLVDLWQQALELVREPDRRTGGRAAHERRAGSPSLGFERGGPGRVSSGEVLLPDDRRHQGRLALHVGPHATHPLHQLGTLEDVLATAKPRQVVEGELRVGGQVR